jgi:hypothetical protein
MKILICCLLVVGLSGCIPIGIQANTRAVKTNVLTGSPAGDAMSSLARY